MGDLISASDASSSYAYLHDVLGRVETATFSSALTGFDVEVGRVYDGLGQRKETSFDVQGAAGDFVNEYEFDLLGRVASIRQSGSGVASKFVDFSYDFATEAIDSIRRFEGTDDSGTLVLTSDFDFDAMGRITGIHHFLDTDADRDWDIAETRLAGYAFAWDVRSRITGIDSLADGQIDFGYDETSQLTSAAYESGHPLHTAGESYQFDSNGNRAMDGYYHGRDNQLLADGQYRYAFDAEGNTTGRTDTATGEHTEYAWDHRGRLASVSVYEDETKADLVSRVVYTYDVFDRRIAKQIDTDGDLDFDSEEHFVYDGDHIAMVFDGSDTLRHRYLHGPVIDMILADEAFDATGDPVELYWALGDHQGTIRDVVIYDDIQEETVLVQHLVIDTFGNLVELQVTTATPILAFIYTGREYDPETGLHYYRARYYDSSTGRFLSQDPIGFRGGDSNLYRYVGNGVVNLTDPSGNSPAGVVVIGGLAIGGGTAIYLLATWDELYLTEDQQEYVDELIEAMKEALLSCADRANDSDLRDSLRKAADRLDSLRITTRREDTGNADKNCESETRAWLDVADPTPPWVVLSHDFFERDIHSQIETLLHESWHAHERDYTEEHTYHYSIAVSPYIVDHDCIEVFAARYRATGDEHVRTWTEWFLEYWGRAPAVFPGP